MFFRKHYITENGKNPLSESVVGVFFGHFLQNFIKMNIFCFYFIPLLFHLHNQCLRLPSGCTLQLSCYNKGSPLPSPYWESLFQSTFLQKRKAGTKHFCKIPVFRLLSCIQLFKTQSKSFSNENPSVTVKTMEDKRILFLVAELSVGSANTRLRFPFPLSTSNTHI